MDKNLDIVEIVKKLKYEFLNESQKDFLFNQIVDIYKDKVFKIVYFIVCGSNSLGTKEDVEEIVIDTFIKFYKNIKNFKFKSSVDTYIYRIAVNLALNFKKSKKQNFLYIEEIDHNFVDKEKQEILNDKDEVRNIILNLLSKLPKKQYVAIILSYYLDFSYKEIAQVMKKSISSVESLLFRAKQNIKKYVLNNKELREKLNI